MRVNAVFVRMNVLLSLALPLSSHMYNKSFPLSVFSHITHTDTISNTNSIFAHSPDKQPMSVRTCLLNGCGWSGLVNMSAVFSSVGTYVTVICSRSVCSRMK